MMRRRDVLAAGAALLASPAVRVSANPLASTSLLDDARAMSRRPYAPSTLQLSPPFADLDYNAYRGIRPLPGLAGMLPHGSDFAVDLLPPGLYFPDPVKIDRVTADGLSEIDFAPACSASSRATSILFLKTAPAPGSPACACATR